MRPPRRRERTTTVPLVGGIDPRLVAFVDKGGALAEQYRRLRTNLQALGAGATSRIVVVSSATDKEGKTLTTLNLAATFAENRNLKILVVDADLRKPMIGARLGQPPGPGLAELLRGEVTPDRALRPSFLPNLTVLTAGEAPEDAAQLLASERMGNLLDLLRVEYDVILVDTAPVLMAADAGILGAHAEGVLMVVKLHETPRALVGQAIESLGRAGARVLGCVVTNVKEQDVKLSAYDYSRE
jgi:capsular exopolysaccharide synthesis family protein